MRFPLAVAALGVLAITGTAGAEPLPVAIEVEWNAPGGCPKKATFESELAQQLPPEASELQDTVSVDVRIRIHETLGYELRISTAVGEREPLTDRDCEKLVRAAAFIVGLSIDVSAPAERAAAPADPVQRYDLESPYTGLVKPEAETPPVVTRDTPIDVVEEKPPIYLALRATLGGDLGILPHPAPAVGFGMAVIRERFRIEATGSVTQSQPATTENPRIGANLGLWTLGLRGCYDVAGGTLKGSVCTGGEIGRFMVDVFGNLGPPENFETRAPWWALTGSAVVERHIVGPFSARLEAGLVLRPIQSPDFTFEIIDTGADDSIHRVPVISARVMSGVEVRFR